MTARNGRVTILDVASASGYSVATVSRALRGFANVSPAAASRIEAVAADLGYRASQLASQLRSGTTRAAILMVPAIDHWYFAELMSGAEALLAEEGYDPFVAVVGDDEALERVLSQIGPRGRVDGVLLADIAMDSATAEMLRGLGIPVVSAGLEAETYSSASIDDRKVGYDATRHLIELGHTRIAVVRGRSHAPDRITSPVLRLAGYRDALRDAGITPDPALEVEVEFTVDGGVAAASTFVGRRQQPTALFCMSDLLAIGAIHTFHHLGFSIPDDVSIVGVDDHELAEALGLTTVAQPVSGIGAAAARLLLDALAEPGRVRHVRLKTELIVRCSTGRPRD